MASQISQCAAFLAILLSASHPVLAQENLLERLSEQEAESNPEAESAIQELLANPLEVNHLAREDLLLLPFLTPERIDTFLAQRQKLGGFENMDEALATLEVMGDTLALCEKIFFLSSPKNALAPQVVTRGRIVRPATIENAWLGAPYRSYERVMLSANALTVGLLAERDPGERRWNDHQLFYGQWQSGTAARGWQVLFGNYKVAWSQGLALWGPYATTISADIHGTSRRYGRGLSSYLAGDENAAWRGLGFAWNQRHFSVLLFASSQHLDVTLADSASAVNFYESGYHRTPSELARRKTMLEKSAGAALKMRWRNQLEFGLLAYSSRYDKPWIRPDLATGHFNFIGQTNALLDLSLSLRTTQWAANLEVARSRSGGVAGSAVLSGEASRLRWTMESHYYARDFHSPRGRGAGSFNDSPQNEFGYSLGLSSRLRQGVTAEFFAGKSQNLWRSSALPLPGSQSTTGVRIEWKIRHDLTLQIRWQQTDDDALVAAARLPATVNREVIAPKQRRSGRCRLDFYASPKLRLISRLD
jgi:hypothetical protein